MRAQGAFLLCLMVLLAGCKLELPAVDTGSIEHHEMVAGSDRVITGTLSESQVKALADWLRAHVTGWDYRIEDTALGLLVHLRRGAVPVVVVNILEGEIKVKDLFRALTPDERATLLAIVEPTKSQ